MSTNSELYSPSFELRAKVTHYLYISADHKGREEKGKG